MVFLFHMSQSYTQPTESSNHRMDEWMNAKCRSPLTSWMRALCRRTLRAFMILTIAACKYILRSSSTALLVCSISWNVTGKQSGNTFNLPQTNHAEKKAEKKRGSDSLTCGVSFCMDVVILNFVLLLVKLIFNENVDSVSMSSCGEKKTIV